MLTLISGLPGASKTLNAIAMVEAMRVAEPDRQVFYWNVGDVTLDGWAPLGDPSTFDLPGVEPDATRAERWFEVPYGSIILLDECQKLWRKRPQGSPVPPWVSRLETHRKQGIDIFGLTQHPKLVDPDVRKLVGRHVHYRRIFGTETYHSWEWVEGQSDPESTSAQSRALEGRGIFPKKFYGTYRSAQVHNVKRRLPVKWLVALGAAVVLVPFLGWVSIHMLRSKLGGSEHPHPAQPVASYSSSGMEGSIGARGVWDARSRAPRVTGFEASAPIYDHVVKVVAVPHVAGCMRLDMGSAVQCQCTSQQGTVLDMTVADCVRFMKRGLFDFMKPDEVTGARRGADVSGIVAGDGPAALLGGGS